MRQQSNKWVYWEKHNDYLCIYTREYNTRRADRCTSFVGTI